MGGLEYIYLAFKLWMLIDALQRGSQYYWFLVIMMPFGDVAYFFLVKINDPEFSRIKRKLLYRPPSLEKLRYQLKQSPSVANRLQLAQALYDRQKYDEALEQFQQILRFDSGDLHALYGAGSAEASKGNFGAAIEHFKQLLSKQFTFKDYEGAVALGECYWRSGEKEKGVEQFKQVVKKGNRLQHKLILAGFLAETGQGGEAKKLLEDALEDFGHAPRFARRTDAPHSRAARRMLSKLQSQPT